MNERDKETLKLVANIFANSAAISIGIAVFEKNWSALGIAIVFGIMAIATIRSGQ